jgi:peptidyl-prolyl cis-trans isomerase B (cyclophilin B)
VSAVRAAVAIAAAALVLTGCVSRTNTAAPASGAPDPGAASAAPADDECGFEEDETTSSDKDPGLPPEDEPVDADTLIFHTSAGAIETELDEDQAPCTVLSMVFLAESGFYDDTSCHRLTAAATLKVLQCGDPSGDGSGGPGYKIPDELPTGLQPGQPDVAGTPTVVYPRGAVAMANAGPDTGGSQFFLVYADSTLPPSYTVFGTLTDDALQILDVVAAGGIAPGGFGPEDGKPNVQVTISSVSAD